MNQRKDEHVKHALEHHNSKRINDFDNVRLVHHSLRAIDVDETNIRTTIGSIDLDIPFFINAMTGGSAYTKEINDKLSKVAQKTGLAMAVGSMSAAFKDPAVWDSFTLVRENHPTGTIFANLNPNYDLDAAKEAVSRLSANALQIHINSAQEVVMPEGDRNFSHWKENIHAIAHGLDVDLIVKEVGFGMSRETIRSLMELGVSIIDVSGRGGTNFAQIENKRRDEHKLDYLEDFGQSTVQSLLEARIYLDSVDLIASGGIRHPLDMIKAFALGANAVGLSAVILNAVMEDGVDETCQMIEAWKEDLHLLMALLGARTIKDLRHADFILSLDLMNYCENRGIDAQAGR